VPNHHRELHETLDRALAKAYNLQDRMKERIQLVEHQGQQIMLIDFSNCTPQEMLDVVDEVQERISDSPPHSMLTMADFTDAEVDKTVATRIKQALVLDRPHVKRAAWVGTESLPKVFYDNFKSFSQREFPAFKTREEAIDWLVKEA
jgi:hypothetical protein